MRRVALTVNGTRHELELEPRELLVYVLRDRLGLTGTNVGCDTSSCGACTVLVDGESVKSCTMLGVQADGAGITTIEGLAKNGDLHPVQQAFHDHHALQCGYCTPGMVLAAVSLIEHGEATSEQAIRGASRGTSAGAPATTTSSWPFRARRLRWGRRHERHGGANRVHRLARQAPRGPGAPHRARHVRRQHGSGGDGLDGRRPQPLRPRPRDEHRSHGRARRGGRGGGLHCG